MAHWVNNPTANAGDAMNAGSIPGSGKSPGGGNGNPLQYSCLKQRSLVGYSPWGRKEAGTTERLSKQASYLGFGRILISSRNCYGDFQSLS